MPPQHPFPAALDDAVAAWTAVRPVCVFIAPCPPWEPHDTDDRPSFIYPIRQHRSNPSNPSLPLQALKGRDAAKVGLFGVSAGGGLAMATVLRLKDVRQGV